MTSCCLVLRLSGASDTTPLIAGLVSAVASTVLIGLWLRRRRTAQKSSGNPRPPTLTSRELGNEPGIEPQTDNGSCTVMIIDDGGHPSPQGGRPLQPPDAHTTAPAEASDDQGLVLTTDAPTPTAIAPTVAGGQVQAVPSSPEQATTISGKDPGPRVGSVGAKHLAAEESVTATISTTTMSTAERVELDQFYEGQHVVSAPSLIDESTRGGKEQGEASSASGRRGSLGGIGLGEAVMEAAQNLAYHCQIPGVSEAASVVFTLVELVSDSRDIKSGGDSNLRQCRSIVRVLERASQVAGRVRQLSGLQCLISSVTCR